jgi:hypothetical protein
MLDLSSAQKIHSGRTSKKALVSNDHPSDLLKWRDISADRTERHAFCGSKGLSTAHETPGTSLKDIRLSSDTAPSDVSEKKTKRKNTKKQIVVEKRQKTV